MFTLEMDNFDPFHDCSCSQSTIYLTVVNADKEMVCSHLLQANPSAPISMFGQVRGFSYFHQNLNFHIF